MTDQDISRRVSKCREMAAKSRDEMTRSYWLRMAQFWYQQDQAVKRAPLSTAAVGPSLSDTTEIFEL